MKKYSPLYLHLFGAPQVFLGGTLVETFSTNKIRGLFIYLATTRQAYTRDNLSGLLWGEMPNKEARVNLRKALSILNKLFPEALVIDRNQVRFNPEYPCTLDINEFNEHIERAQEDDPHRKEHLQQAVDLYQGEFLAGFYLPDTPVFSQWVFGLREHLGQKALQSMAALAQVYSDERAFPPAVELFQRMLGIDPWCENTHRNLMLAYARMGNYNAALAQYHTCRKILSKELDVLPSIETHKLYERIKSRRDSSGGNLPRQATPFVGREEEIETVVSLLSSAACRLLTITGIGGAGKTRLAIEAAKQLQQFFLDGVFFVSTASVHEEQALISVIGSATGSPFGKQNSLLKQLVQQLEQREVLLVIDNFEHLTANAPILEHILESCPGVKFLVTSREPLLSAWEQVFLLGGLPVDGQPSGKKVDSASVQLFVQTARRIRHDFELSAEDAPVVREICRHLDGIPLGIELAAPWVVSLTCRQILENIRKTTTFLERPEKADAANQSAESLQSVLEYTWQQLPSGTQRCFTRMSVFNDSFSLEAARAVAGASEHVLTHLLSRGLLSRVTREDSAHYAMHSLWQQFTARKLAALPEEAGEAEHAHFRYYFDLLKTTVRPLSLTQAGQAAFPDEPAFNNMRKGWEYAIRDADYAAFEAYTRALARLLEARNRYEELRTMLKRALERAKPHHSKRLQAHWLRLIGESLFRSGKLSESLDYHRQALRTLGLPMPATLFSRSLALAGEVIRQIFHRMVKPRMTPHNTPEAGTLLEGARTLERLGQILFFKNEATVTLLYTSVRGMNLAEKVAPSATLSRLYGNMILGSGMATAHRLARYYRKLALDVAQHIEDPAALSWVLELSSLYHCGIRQWDDAAKEARQAIRLAQSLGDSRRVDECQVMLAHIDCQQGRFRQSAERWLDIYLSAYKRGDVQAQRWGLSGQAENFLPLGRTDEAISYTKTALEMPLEVTDTGTDVSCYGLLARAYMMQGKTEEALRAANAGLDLISSTSITAFSSLEGYISLAFVFLRLWEADPENALFARSAKKAEAILWKFSRIFTIAEPQALLHRGMLAWMRSQPEKARHFWQSGLVLASKAKMPYQEALICAELVHRLPAEDPLSASSRGRIGEICSVLNIPKPPLSPKNQSRP